MNRSQLIRYYGALDKVAAALYHKPYDQLTDMGQAICEQSLSARLNVVNAPMFRRRTPFGQIPQQVAA